MEMQTIGAAGPQASRVVLGTMRMARLAVQDAATVLSAAVAGGINLFDHADIYGAGESERIFGKAMRHAGIPRDSILIQSKCGIRRGFYDSSKEHILTSVDGILSRLDTDYLDILLIHRPDALVQPEEVAEAFDALYQSGKVRYFGVSNHHSMQIELLKRHVRQPLIANQLQFSPAHTGMVDCGIHANTRADNAIHRDGMVLDYCRLNDITIQAWSPLQHGMIEGVFLENPDYAELNAEIRLQAEKYGTTETALVLCWILRHPANMQVILGSMNPGRISQVCAKAHTRLSREDWYSIYRAAGNTLP